MVLEGLCGGIGRVLWQNWQGCVVVLVELCSGIGRVVVLVGLCSGIGRVVVLVGLCGGIGGFCGGIGRVV